MPKKKGGDSLVSGVRDAAEKFANGVMSALSPAEPDGTPENQGGTDAIELLKHDHREVTALFAQANSLSDTAFAARARIFAQIADALELHTRVEETIFYPAFKDKTKRNSDERDEVLEAYEEHAAAKDLIAKLRALDARDQTYKAKVQVLSEMIHHHVEEEEGTFFPEARRLLGDAELKELGGRIEAAKKAGPDGTRRPAAAKSPAIRGTRAVARPPARRKTGAKKRSR